MQVSQFNSKQLQYTFNKVASHYDSVAVLQQTVTEGLLRRLDIMKINPNIIVDVGCATGYSGRLLQKKFKQARIINIDFSTSMLHIARKKRAYFSKQAFIAADATSLPLADHSVDMIFANLLLHWTNNFQATLAEWQRVLKPSGILLFSCFGMDTLQELRASCAAIDDNIHVHTFLDMHDIGDAVLRAGFANPIFDTENFQLTYKDIDDLLKELKMSGYQNADIHRAKGLFGKNKKQQLFAAYERFKSDEHLYPVSYEVIFGHGWAPDKISQKNTSTTEHLVPIAAIRKK